MKSDERVRQLPHEKARVVGELAGISHVNSEALGKVGNVTEVDDLVKAQDPVVVALEQNAEVIYDKGAGSEEQSTHYYKVVDPLIRANSSSESSSGQSYWQERLRAQGAQELVAELRGVVLSEQIESAESPEQLEEVLKQAPEIATIMFGDEEQRRKAYMEAWVRYQDSGEHAEEFRQRRGKLVRAALIKCLTMAEVDAVCEKFPEVDQIRHKYDDRDESGRPQIRAVPNENWYSTQINENSLHALSAIPGETRTALVVQEINKARTEDEFEEVMVRQVPGYAQAREKIQSVSLGNPKLTEEDLRLEGGDERAERFRSDDELLYVAQEKRSELVLAELAKTKSMAEVDAFLKARPDFNNWLDNLDNPVPFAQRVPEFESYKAGVDYLYGFSASYDLALATRTRRSEFLTQAMQAGKADEILGLDTELSQWIDMRTDRTTKVFMTAWENFPGAALDRKAAELFWLEERMARKYSNETLRVLAEKKGIQDLFKSTTGGKGSVEV